MWFGNSLKLNNIKEHGTLWLTLSHLEPGDFYCLYPNSANPKIKKTNNNCNPKVTFTNILNLRQHVSLCFAGDCLPSNPCFHIRAKLSTSTCLCKLNKVMVFHEKKKHHRI